MVIFCCCDIYECVVELLHGCAVRYERVDELLCACAVRYERVDELLCFCAVRYERVDELIWVKTNQLQRIIRTGRTGHWFNHGKEHCLVRSTPFPSAFRFTLHWCRPPSKYSSARRCLNKFVQCMNTLQISTKKKKKETKYKRLHCDAAVHVCGNDLFHCLIT